MGISRGVLGLITTLLFLTFFDVKAVIEGFALLGIMAIGPVTLIAYMMYVSRHPANDFSVMRPGNRLAFIGTLTFMFLSTGGICSYVFMNPSLFFPS